MSCMLILANTLAHVKRFALSSEFLSYYGIYVAVYYDMQRMSEKHMHCVLSMYQGVPLCANT